MNTPVNFEIAKLLQAKGFDIPCREGWVNYLESFTGETRMPDDESNLVIDRLGNRHLIERPTISDVVMWLYEKHGIWISVSDAGGFGCMIQFMKIDGDSTIEGLYEYESPTEAYEASIEYTLINLIK